MKIQLESELVQSIIGFMDGFGDLTVQETAMMNILKCTVENHSTNGVTDVIGKCGQNFKARLFLMHHVRKLEERIEELESK